jgi:hypothetical protein
MESRTELAFAQVPPIGLGLSMASRKMTMINRTDFENELFSHCQSTCRLRQEDARQWPQRSWAANGAAQVVAHRGVNAFAGKK